MRIENRELRIEIMKHEYKNLEIWKRARMLNKEIYKLTMKFPDSEKFGLTNQIRRSSVSIISNIAEGSGYNNDRQFIRFLKIALGSLCELEAQLYICNDLEFTNHSEIVNVFNELDEIKRMIIGLLKKLK